MTEDRTSEQYWDDRVKSHPDPLRMVWYSGKTLEHEQFTASVIDQWKDCTVLDIGCGYGRMAKYFKPENYLGVDFSGEMIKKAKELYPDYAFLKEDCKTYIPKQKYDIILAMIYCRCAEVPIPDFVEQFRKYANTAVVVIDRDSIVIAPPQSYA